MAMAEPPGPKRINEKDLVIIKELGGYTVHAFTLLCVYVLMCVCLHVYPSAPVWVYICVYLRAFI